MTFFLPEARRPTGRKQLLGVGACALGTRGRGPNVQPAIVGARDTVVSATREVGFGGVKDFFEMGHEGFSYLFELRHCGSFLKNFSLRISDRIGCHKAITPEAWRRKIGRWYRRYFSSGQGDERLLEWTQTDTKVLWTAARRAAHSSVMEDGHERMGTQNELRSAVDALPGLVWTALPDGHIDFLNQRWCKYTGLSLEQACGWGWQTAIHPQDLPELLKCWRSILASGEQGEMEARLWRFDGEYRWFLVSSSPLRDAGGKIIEWFGVSTDIDDRRRAEEALHTRELSFRLIVDSIPAPVAVMTPAGELEGVNQPALEYFGKAFKDLEGWTTSDAVHPDDLPQVVTVWREAVETGCPYEVEHRLRRFDGVYRWFHLHGFPLRDHEGASSSGVSC